ncbi:putative oxidoreductase YurR [Gossypium arboreum]|uniref:Putative oxidoreductase YurR n=1 Tax=Gossypium arboreum TaxID=29729 RepID=A0A0B0NKI9_GOSAR|nr:putative oxidoreductase YurR [Gossypium arboreum]
MVLFDSSISPLTHAAKFSSPLLLSSLSHRPLRYAVLGAGFAGLSVAWHLLKESPKDLNLHIDLYDEMGIGGGASGVSGGLLHPYSPKVKLLWSGAECWKECMKLLSIAEQAVSSEEDFVSLSGEFDQDFGGILDRRRHFSALFLACQNIVKELSASGFGKKNLCLQKKSVNELRELEGEYDAVIICLGAKADLLPELAGKLPLRTSRGVILHLQLPDNIGEDYPDHGPSILSDAWLAIKGNRSLYLGSTWEWKSRNSSSNVSTDEASDALQELLPKASAIYPGITSWSFAGARAGLRAMPPLTPHGSLPLLGCVNNILGNDLKCKYWLLGGLGSRGLLYHGWLGKLTAEAVLSCNEQIIPSELTSWKNKDSRP